MQDLGGAWRWPSRADGVHGRSLGIEPAYTPDSSTLIDQIDEIGSVDASE